MLTYTPTLNVYFKNVPWTWTFENYFHNYEAKHPKKLALPKQKVRKYEDEQSDFDQKLRKSVKWALTLGTSSVKCSITSEFIPFVYLSILLF